MQYYLFAVLLLVFGVGRFVIQSIIREMTPSPSSH